MRFNTTTPTRQLGHSDKLNKALRRGLKHAKEFTISQRGYSSLTIIVEDDHSLEEYNHLPYSNQWGNIK